jgi:hypothetical protein
MGVETNWMESFLKKLIVNDNSMAISFDNLCSMMSGDETKKYQEKSPLLLHYAHNCVPGLMWKSPNRKTGLVSLLNKFKASA